MVYVRLILLSTVVLILSMHVHVLAAESRDEAENECNQKYVLLIQVRRCIRHYDQLQENKATAEKRLNRRALHQEKKNMRGTLLKNQTERYRQRRIQQDRTQRILQSQQKKASSTLQSTRSNSRRAVREREAIIKLQRKQNQKIQQESGQQCKSETGTQRIMCIRELIRETQRR